MELTEDQMKLIRMYATKAKVETEDVIQWVKEWKTSVAELSMGILWMPV